MIAVIDYNAGNLTSVLKALRTLGVADALVTADPSVVRYADRIILPGVGHFASTKVLTDSGINPSVREAIAAGTPFLGICVGLQWLFAGSTEADGIPGLGVFPGMCERFPANAKVPHVGWNSLHVAAGSRLLEGIPDGAYVYYTHSYRAPILAQTVGVTDYDGPFTGAVESGNVMGVQFHPEKSSETGLQVLRNFLHWTPRC